MSESKSDALPLGDIPMLERHPLNGHMGDYIMRQRILQSFFSEIRAFFQEGKVFPSRNANFTCHANRISTENRNLAGKMLEKAGRGQAPALPYRRTDIFNESNFNFSAASGRGAQRMLWDRPGC